MSDILSQLERSCSECYVEFARITETAKCPNRSRFSSFLYILYADKDYCIWADSSKTNDDRDIEIGTGVEITSARNVDLVAFAPKNRHFYQELFMKEPEIFIDASYRGELSFLASELYQSEFLDPETTCIFIQKGDPICYLQISKSNLDGILIKISSKVSESL